MFRTVLLLLALTTTSLAQAQVNPAVADYTNDIEAARTLAQTERKVLIMSQMVMTADEAEAFWPLYDEYTAARKKVGNLRVKVITDYAARFESMDEATARQLLDDALRYEQQMLKLKQKYVKKFRKILPDVKVTRYFQLENKLDALVDFDMAGEIPLIE
ncbi:MAG: hypothetical protein V2J12_03300 [Gammaproteobacteria bacterium]|jgi:hypothetical protein|nr:hypothetical protein [Gammaproteobacteria bacterium]